MNSRINLFAFFLNSFFITITACYSQSNWRVEFPQAFQGRSKSVVVVFPTWQAIGLDESQRKLALELDVEFDRRLEELKNLGKLNLQTLSEISQELIQDFEFILTPEQQAKLDQLFVADYLRKKANRNTDLPRPQDSQIDGLILLPDIVATADIRQEQVATVKAAYETANSGIKEVKDQLPKLLDDLFKRWQADLERQLLIHQKADFDAALGEPFSTPKILANVVGMYSRSPPQFLDLDNNITHSLNAGKPKPEQFLVQTPWFIDCRPNPTGFFAFLLAPEVVQELKLTSSQIERLIGQQEAWNADHPLPPRLTITILFGRDVTNRKQREAAFEEQAYADTYHEIYQVLDQKQGIRLKQAWNRTMMSAGWSQVPLTFPDWQSYLELSNGQIESFQAIREKYLKEFRSLENDLRLKIAEQAERYWETVADTLEETQRRKIEQILGFKFKTPEH
jgi:hypothetical protein